MKRGLSAPLLFLALGLSAQGSVEASPTLWTTALVTLAAAHFLTSPSADARSFTPLAAAVVFLAIWMGLTNKWANPSYTAAAPYHAAFLLGGFFLGRRAGPENAQRLFGVALAFALCVAAWALLQNLGGEVRAHAFFETPATLSGTINLILLPAWVCVLAGKRRGALIAALVLLTAATLAATSRGGWFALAIGGLAAWQLGRRAGILVRPQTLSLPIAVFALAWLVTSLGPDLVGMIRAPGGMPEQVQSYSMLASQSSVARLELYELAWRSIAPSSLFTGFGYLGYYYLLEAGRASVATYENSITYFAHNDYLQTLLELGVPGLAGLLAIVILPLVAAWRAAPKLQRDSVDRVILVALVAGLSSMSTHALVDFPFYIPLCLLIYGAMLGLLDSILPRAASVEPSRRPLGSVAASLQRAGGAAAATVVVWLLAMPVAAETAARYAHRQWRSAQGESAAYWFEVARRLEPQDWRYHWYAGQFWFAQAAQSRKPEAARFADRAFADGVAANPREVRNLLGRISTHRALRQLLSAPADSSTVIAWSERALALAPHSSLARMERAQVLKELGSPIGGTPKWAK